MVDTAAPRPRNLAPRVSAATDDILAAGAVVWRAGPEVALVHRPRYDDWSLPKGKLDAGESLGSAAVREVREETGVAVRLGPWLGDVRYPVEDGHKLVRYWSAEALSSSGFVPNDEVDELRWLPPKEAADLLSYAHDVDVLDRFVELGPPSSLLVLVRHAKAGSRHDWDGDDDLRPLSESGRKQADEVAALLALFRPDRIAAAPPVRCRDTVAPLALALDLSITDEPLLGEDGYDASATLARVNKLAAMPGVTVVASQGGVIPATVAALVKDAALPVAVDPDDVPAKKASTWVLGMRGRALVSADYIERPGG